MNEARDIYKNVELEGRVNIDTIKQQKEGVRLSKNNTDDEEELNPYHNIIINNLD